MPKKFTSNQSTTSRPRIALTVGDAAGVGPELALKAAASDMIWARCHLTLYGPEGLLKDLARRFDLPLPAIVDVPLSDSVALKAGVHSASTGLASYTAVCQAIDDTLGKRRDAIVTGPIQKEAWHAAGIEFPGHTELLGARTSTENFSMMLTSESISCVLATIHIPIADVPKCLTTDSILRSIRHGASALERRLQRKPRVAVCGLNPHAGENGLFSYGEETRIIQPAIVAARREGLDVIGPLPPDTAFTPQMRERVDVYVCMYHDQGLIPLKAIAFDDGVNVTLGLPIVRTSVDHGTAMDIAWQGIASHRSMIAAIEMAIELA